MKNLTATICLTLAVLLGSAGASWGDDKSGGDRALEEFATLVVVRNLAQLKIYGDPATQRRSSEKHYKAISSAKLKKRLFSGLKKAGIELFEYDDFAADCDAPNKSKFEDAFATKGSFPSRIWRAAYKAVQTCEIKYFIIVTLTLDGLSEREKGRILFEAKAKVYELSRPIARTIAFERFEGHSAGARIRDAREAVYEKVTAKLVGGKVAGSNKVYKGELLQTVRNKLEAKQRTR
jgi:hypothetical protein